MTHPSTDYRPTPESTDSDYNNLLRDWSAAQDTIEQQRAELLELASRIDQQAETIRVVTEHRDRLQNENDNLNAHLEADHEALRQFAGATGLDTIHDDSDPYDGELDEDSPEYQFPPQPRTIDSV